MKRERRFNERVAKILFPESTKEAHLSFGLMRPLSLPNWEAVMGKLKPTSLRPGLWYRDWVPASWVEDAKSLEEAGSLDISDWGDLFKLPEPMVQRRLEDSASRDIVVDLDRTGPEKDQFGLRITNSRAERIILDEASMLGAQSKKLLHISLGRNATVRLHREINLQLAQACKMPENYLGPLCVMSTQPPVA